MKRIYLDYAASTPVNPRVVRAMRPYFTERYGNPGSLHSFGQEAIAAVDKSRATVARLIGAEFREIIFTGSATEANNLALRGVVKSIKYQVSSIKKPKVVVSAVEHESVLETARDLEREGTELVLLPVDRRGVVDLKKLEAALDRRTVLVSVMYGNNEIGTIQPIAEISKLIADFRSAKSGSRAALRSISPASPRRRVEAGEARRLGPLVSRGPERRRAESEADSLAGSESRRLREAARLPHPHPLFHTDAAQAFQFLNCDVNDLGVDLMTLSAHKIYGPKGVGALYVKDLGFSHEDLEKKALREVRTPPLSSNGYFLNSLVTGGGQEFGFRSGTENVPLVVGFARAAELIEEKKEHHAERIRSLRDHFWRELKNKHPDAEVNGAVKGALPSILNVYLPGYEAQDVLIKLDLAGVAVSSGSACRSRSFEPSYVIEALGRSRKQAKQSVRVSFGRPTTKKDVDRALAVFLKLFP